MHAVLVEDVEVEVADELIDADNNPRPGARLLVVAGKPLGEPVAWGGPIVMNTQAELEQAFREYRDGTFIKVGATTRK